LKFGSSSLEIKNSGITKVIKTLFYFTCKKFVLHLAALPVLMALSACSQASGDIEADGEVWSEPTPSLVQTQTNALPVSTPTSELENNQTELTVTQDLQEILPTSEQISPLAIDCIPNADLTPSLAEGPFYKIGSPQRSSLIEEDMTGTRLQLSGFVLTSDCQPVAGALLDFWQADNLGVYDNAGYRLRGHQCTDENGRYFLETIVPANYPGRTPHIHVRVESPHSTILVTQIFFPDEPANLTDRIFSPNLLISIVEQEEHAIQGEINFIISGG
jgi:protocatechuate 3,4-dioxygenase beta subunit